MNIAKSIRIVLFFGAFSIFANDGKVSLKSTGNETKKAEMELTIEGSVAEKMMNTVGGVKVNPEDPGGVAAVVAHTQVKERGNVRCTETLEGNGPKRDYSCVIRIDETGFCLPVSVSKEERSPHSGNSNKGNH